MSVVLELQRVRIDTLKCKERLEELRTAYEHAKMPRKILEEHNALLLKLLTEMTGSLLSVIEYVS